jgi:hypothetical protein
MKILFINSMKYDYLQDIVHAGLVKHLGAEDVHPFPFNPSFGTKVRKYPKNLGYAPGTIKAMVDGIFRKFRYDAVIVAACKKSAFKSYLSIIEKIPSQCPVIFLDGGDSPEIGGDLTKKNCFGLFTQAQQFRNFDLIFKREKLLNTDYGNNVLPCPFAYNPTITKKLKDLPEIHDVVFWAAETDPVRTRAFDIIHDKYDCHANGSVGKQSLKSFSYHGKTYLQHLRQSKIVLNFRGTGWDTLRYWEAVALPAFMISQKPAIEISDAFVDGEHLIYCKNDLSDLTTLIDKYLDNPTERIRMKKNATVHFNTYHTDIARAKYISDQIKDKVL